MEAAAAEESARFLPLEKPVDVNGSHDDYAFGKLLTREDLLNLDRNEPKWRRMRILLLILFCIIWLGLLTASIIVIVLSPGCPPVESLNFWQSKVGYWVDPFAFRDSDGDGVGDFNGLSEKIHYIKNTLGAGFLVLSDFVKGQYGDHTHLGLTTDFDVPSPLLGTQKQFRSMVKAYHKEGLEVVVSLDFNAVHQTHKWVSNHNQTVSQSWYTRSDIARHPGVYSAFGSETVDLNLDDTNLIEKIKVVVKHWLNEGADGILLSNAAFYKENLSRTGEHQIWAQSAMEHQVFVSGSEQVVKALRSVVSDVSRTTSKPRVLIVDAGDTGFGVTFNVDNSLMFLGTKEDPIAHLVVSRLFTRNRGSKFESDTSEPVTIEQFGDIYSKQKRGLALVTATPTDRYHDDTILLASTLLLPGTPLIYYGAELGQEIAGIISFNRTDVYPQDKVPLVNKYANDSQLACHLPMPWDKTGKGFTTKPLTNPFTHAEETVERVTAPGRGDTPFKLVQSLISLRKNEPSFLWGEFEKLGEVNIVNVEMFMRKAQGYEAFVILLIRDADKFGSIIHFPDTCKQLTPKILHPSPPNLKVDKVIEGNRVFVEVDNGNAVYVFKCHDL